MSLSVNCSFSSVDSPCSHVGIGSEKIPLMACKIDIKPQLENLGAVTVKSVSPNFPLGVISL